MKRVSFLIACQFVFCLFIFSGCTPKKTEKNNEIMYKDKILSLEMPKENVDALLGEGTLIGELQPGNEDIYIYIYQYDKLEVSYYMYHTEKTLYVSSFSWTTQGIYSYTGIRIGDSIKKVKDFHPEYSNSTETSYYSVYFYSDGKFGTISDGDFSLAESKHSFIYNDKNKITEIVISKAKPSS